jgi:hypothetical protein
LLSLVREHLPADVEIISSVEPQRPSADSISQEVGSGFIETACGLGEIVCPPDVFVALRRGACGEASLLSCCPSIHGAQVQCVCVCVYLCVSVFLRASVHVHA